VKYVKVLFVGKIASEEGFLKQRILLHPKPKISGVLYPEMLSSRFSTKFGAPSAGI
jgi:hypothetical protein